MAVRRDIGGSRQFSRGQGASIQESHEHGGSRGIGDEGGRGGERDFRVHTVRVARRETTMIQPRMKYQQQGGGQLPVMCYAGAAVA